MAQQQTKAQFNKLWPRRSTGAYLGDRICRRARAEAWLPPVYLDAQGVCGRLVGLGLKIYNPKEATSCLNHRTSVQEEVTTSLELQWDCCVEDGLGAGGGRSHTLFKLYRQDFYGWLSHFLLLFLNWICPIMRLPAWNIDPTLFFPELFLSPRLCWAAILSATPAKKNRKMSRNNHSWRLIERTMLYKNRETPLSLSSFTTWQKRMSALECTLICFCHVDVLAVFCLDLAV